MPVVVLGISYRTSPVTVRERFAFKDAELPAVLEKIRASGVAQEAVVLSTCNRVEIYAATDGDGLAAIAGLKKFLLTDRQFTEPADEYLFSASDAKSLEHLFKVAAGLDSMVLGETEILGQLKQAYDLALQHKATGGRLNKAFQKAFNVAKLLRTETGIQRGATSVAAVAVELAEKIFTNLNHRQVMVIGAGDTSEKAARALLSRGAHSLIVANRSHDRAEALAKELNGRAVHFDLLAESLLAVDIVISSTSAPHFVLDRAKLEPVMKRRKGRPLLLVDIAVPRDIEPEVNFLNDVYLYNIDDLQAIAADYLKQRQDEIARCEAIIREKVAELLAARPPHSGGGAPRPAFGHESGRA
ncbi:MAG: glutamyl-tRNA reductase [Verrucomicrobia bacterium]|nr:glutamyl-tRNA reductase [Verrucomicrobiota bacterium]